MDALILTFPIGRDHAGPGVDKQGKPFYEEYEAQELFQKHEKELGIQMVGFEKIGYSPKQKKYIFQKGLILVHKMVFPIIK